MTSPAPPARENTDGLAQYLRTETFGGVVLLIAAAVALIWINSPWGESYVTLRDTHIGIDWAHLDLTVGHWAQEGLLAVFFFVAGVELKRELVIGELSDVKQAILPVLAAAGGVITPAIICLSIGWGTDGIDKAWAIPVATDIAFALGVLALVGSRVPSGARIFLLALAVVDDLIAIVIIAVVFSASFNLIAGAVAIAALGCFAFAQHRRITTPFLYVPLALVIWVAVLNSGIHATIAGVAMGLLMRVRSDPGEKSSPAIRMEHLIQPYSAALCVPLFALFACGVPLSVDVIGDLFTDRLNLGIMVGLLVGKVVGIFGVSWLTIKIGIARRPDELKLPDLLAVSVLGGIGFTVSLLIAELALPEHAAETAKAAVLLTSMVAAIVGSALLLMRSRPAEPDPSD